MERNGETRVVGVGEEGASGRAWGLAAARTPSATTGRGTECWPERPLPVAPAPPRQCGGAWPPSLSFLRQMLGPAAPSSKGYGCQLTLCLIPAPRAWGPQSQLAPLFFLGTLWPSPTGCSAGDPDVGT